ncbi:MAG: hypothetical protein LBD68_08855 [Zoogloeaceae bacterium]|jgi:hypothetical protein|nr:hypothetical protein [Zoogloeaceae bacterium]
MLKKLRRRFGCQADPLSVYRADRLDNKSVNEIRYPAKASLVSTGLYAYRLFFLISDAAADRVRQAIKTAFSDASESPYFVLETTNQKGFSINVSIQAEQTLHGTLIEMVTNNADLLAALDDLELEPMTPWSVFPELDPDSMGSLQGNIEFWWNHFFLPFWNFLDADGKKRYLDKAPSGWAEFILCHT